MSDGPETAGAKSSVGQRAVASVKWSALMEMVSRTVSPLVFLLLARLLKPDDFGIVATATIAISFSQVFWEAGLGKALVQTNEETCASADVVFWTNALLGLAIYAALFLTAPWLAAFFNSPASMPVLRVLGLQVVIGSLGAVQQALFVRDLGFRRLFWVKLATALVPGLLSVPMALIGYGVWALVGGSLAGSLMNLGLLWRYSPWRPRFRYDRRVARRLLAFGGWVAGEGFLAWLLMWSDSILLGRFLGTEELGVYRVGWTITTMLFGLVLNPFLPVLYPTFSRLQDDHDQLKEVFRRANRVVFSLALPVGLGLLVMGPALAAALFGERWQGLGLVISAIGFLNGMAWLVGINPEVYRALGRPDLNTKLMFLTLLYYLPAYVVAAPLGLETFVWVRVGLGLLATPIHVYLCVRTLGVSPWYLWYQGKPMLVATGAMAATLLGLRFALQAMTHPMAPALAFATPLAASVLVFSAVLWVVDRSFVREATSLIRRAARP